MYIDNENFEKWMEKLSKKLTEIGKDLKSLINTDKVLDDNEKILDNQDLAFLLKVSLVTYSPENRIQIVVNEKIIKPFYLMFIRSFKVS